VSSEKQIETAIRVALFKAYAMVKKNRIEACWSCGAKPRKTDGMGVGSSDLICCVPPYGRYLAIEVKSERGKPSPEQLEFMDAVQHYRGVAGVARSVEEAFQLLDMARRLP
jgi:hypothetical protein